MSDEQIHFSDLQLATIDAIVSLFESNSPARYDAVAHSASDAGGLSYGKHQAALVGGQLYKLIKLYCDTPGAKYADNFRTYLPAMQAGDRTLDNDTALIALLKKAATDPVMQDVQDRYFRDNYMRPALQEVQSCGFVNALSCAVVYDSFIQGSWSHGANIKGRTVAKVGAPSAANEKDWILAYLATRRAWLVSRGADLARSVYRIDALTALVNAGTWDLALPVPVAMTNYVFTLSAWDLNAHLFSDPVFRIDPDHFGVVKARMAIAAEGRDRHVQSLMAALGLVDPVKGVDGRFGVNSANAFKAFQLSCGAPQTGVVDQDAYLLLCDAYRRRVDPPKGAGTDALRELPPSKHPDVDRPLAGASAVTGAGAVAALAGATALPSTSASTPPATTQAPPPTALTATPAPPPAPPAEAVKDATKPAASSPATAPTQAPAAATPAQQTSPATPAPAPSKAPAASAKTQAPPAPAKSESTTTAASTAVPPAAPEWLSLGREVLPWVAIALLVLTAVLILTGRRRAY